MENEIRNIILNRKNQISKLIFDLKNEMIKNEEMKMNIDYLDNALFSILMIEL